MSKPVCMSNLSLHGWWKGNISLANNPLSLFAFYLFVYLFRNNSFPIYRGFFLWELHWKHLIHTSQKTKLFLWFLRSAMWTDVKQGNTLDESWNISSLKCRHTEWWYSQQEAVLSYQQGQGLSICPHNTCRLKVKALKSSTQGAWPPNLVRWSVNTSTTREQNSTSTLYQWGLQKEDSGDSLQEPGLSPTHSPLLNSPPQQQFLPVLCMLILSFKSASPSICR